MSNIKVEDVEIVIKEMLEEERVINPETICNHMGIEPIIVIRDKNGIYVGHVNNKLQIYNHIRKLHEMRIEWRVEVREGSESFKEGYENASFWDNKQEKMIYYKDKMSYKEFVDMRIPKRGIVLVPSSNNPREYIIPNPEEERIWIKKSLGSGGKTIKTRVESGIDAGHIKDTIKTQRFLEGFKPNKQLDFIEIEKTLMTPLEKEDKKEVIKK